MTYILMHKNLQVAKIHIDNTGFLVTGISEVYNEHHLPVGVRCQEGIAESFALDHWWKDRSIPQSRHGIRDVCFAFSCKNAYSLPLGSLGLSLSDHYWIRPADRANLRWDEVNFYCNPFSGVLGDVLLGKKLPNGMEDLCTPDFACNGSLRKCWRRINNRLCLIKAGTPPLLLESFYEVIASVIAERLGIPHVTYTLLWEEGVPYCICDSFTDTNAEFVSARQIMSTKAVTPGTDLYQHFLRCCRSLGITDMIPALDQMLVLDYLIGNVDRHFNNFGMLRDPETLSWLSPAPIFDCGSSFGYNKLPSQIQSGSKPVCKPFRERHEDQLALVTSFDWIHFDRLQDIESAIYDAFSDAGEYADTHRIRAVITSLRHRIEAMKDYICHSSPTGRLPKPLVDEPNEIAYAAMDPAEKGQDMHDSFKNATERIEAPNS